jgi:hypothetical protein
MLLANTGDVAPSIVAESFGIHVRLAGSPGDAISGSACTDNGAGSDGYPRSPMSEGNCRRQARWLASILP